MGYCIEQIDNDFYIKAENLQACANAVLNAMRGKDQVGWVRSSDINEHMSFIELAEEFRWDMHVNDEGDIYDICFTGEKIGEDIDLFLNSIAPYVLDESFISFIGEDGSQWRYFFKDKQMLDQTGTVTYD